MSRSSHHEHTFGLEQAGSSERRTLIVVLITAVTMVIEIAAGLVYGSMALLADGLHMASHAVALGIAAFAYRYVRRHAADRRFSFGTGKVNALAGYSGAVLLGVFALGMAAESLERFVNPVVIEVNQALLVAVLGLLVNGASVLILGSSGDHHGHQHGHSHGRARLHEHDPEHARDQKHEHAGEHDRGPGPNHNFRAAYFHVIADALTSVLAIGALLSAKFYGLTWLDPAMGIVGAVLVARWSVGLLRESGQVLLDFQAPQGVLSRLREVLEEPGTEVVDLHVWSVGPGRRAAIIAIAAERPLPLEEYRRRLPEDLGLVHVTIELGTCQDPVLDLNRCCPAPWTWRCSYLADPVTEQIL